GGAEDELLKAIDQGPAREVVKRAARVQVKAQVVRRIEVVAVNPREVGPELEAMLLVGVGVVVLDLVGVAGDVGRAAVLPQSQVAARGKEQAGSSPQSADGVWRGIGIVDDGRRLIVLNAGRLPKGTLALRDAAEGHPEFVQ